MEAKIRTLSGRLVDLLDFKPEDVDFDDIAIALSNICRYTGHVPINYNVAEHSIIVAQSLPDELFIYGLAHDMHEAYTNDISSPWKNAIRTFWTPCEDNGFRTYDAVVDDIDKSIFKALGLDYEFYCNHYDTIKEADYLAYEEESEGNFFSLGMGHEASYRLFKDLFYKNLPKKQED